jgi:hypothetical protein
LGKGKGRRDAANVLGNDKPRRPQFLLEQRSTLRLLITDLGELPNLLGHLGQMFGFRIEALNDCRAVRVGQFTTDLTRGKE